MRRVQPLMIKGMNNTTDEVVRANLEATFARGYTPLMIGQERNGPVSIVGSGPSLARNYKDVVGDVIACNSAHDFLVSKGVIPKFAMIWDANPVMEKILRPHKDVTYLIASRCHPSVFDLLNGYKVLVWHALGGDSVERYLIDRKREEPVIAGGSSSVTRATHVAATMGYRKEMHLFGVDSCYSDGKTHVNGSVIEQKSMRLLVCGRWFTVAPWMAMQGEDFKLIAPIMKKNGVKLSVHGTGLLPYLATFLGDVETPDMHISWWEKSFKRKVYSVLALYTVLRTKPQLLGENYAAGY